MLRLREGHVDPEEYAQGEVSLDARQLIREPAAGQSSDRAFGAMGGAVLNWIWLGLILLAVVYGAFTGRMQEVSAASFDGAKSAVQLVIGLTGFMVFMLGLMRVATDGGLLRAVARGIAPMMRRLFPEVPPEHPAMAAMVMNFATNVLGLGNAATPFGLKAMRELETLNRHPGVASDSMVLFLSINATAITLFPPTGTMAVRAAAGSAAPEAIWVPTLIATTCSTLTAVVVFYLLRGWPRYAARPLADAPVSTPPPAASSAAAANDEIERALRGPVESAGPARRALVAVVSVALLLGLSLEAARRLSTQAAGDVATSMLQSWLFPVLIVSLLLVGVSGRARVYESMVEGAKEGLEVVVRILPYLVAILVAVAMFRASGALDLVISLLAPLTTPLGFPAEALPMALLRPLSGSGAFAVMSEIVTVYGPDSFIGNLACTIQGSTETTFYVLTLYYGASGTRNIRHTLVACLVGDVAGVVGATAACHAFFG
jgi:spore maturation protein SpmA